jgi:hypothetical protein
MFLEKQRLAALVRVARAFMTASVEWLGEMLGLTTEAEVIAFLKSVNAVMKDGKTLDCRAAYPSLAAHPLLAGTKNKLMG